MRAYKKPKLSRVAYGVDYIMAKYSIGRFKARDIQDLASLKGITIDEAYKLYFSNEGTGKDVDEL
jgi:hypothetical protein